MTIGIFGGSFDPIHTGHLLVAETVRSDRGLDRVLFVPAAMPPHKPEGTEAPGEDRLEMARAAVVGIPSLDVSDAEIRRGGISYTLDTLEGFSRLHATAGSRFFLIVGMDSLMDIPNWKRPESILERAGLLAVERPGYSLGQLPGWLEKRVEFVRAPRVDISSTEIRERVRLGKSIRVWVPNPVERHIQERGLYR